MTKYMKRRGKKGQEKNKNAGREYEKKELIQKGRKSKKKSGCEGRFGRHSIQVQMND
jgi:hypothetical protein